ncbi:head GIN domain-containing protein [Pedobacter metabolipauper]|uniref:Putative autotransporter adhesin-like protein n=1 Tax=Pedobacter metabolipauper TaxID=425513 RepID=A0A4R6T011_9SPHI|nr:head GIN domain-containing protein [Pedobacter metabolipauper]TDQ10362.1 putative autotransporter adhesin-like protein [Pedobacter metabolipauper]
MRNLFTIKSASLLLVFSIAALSLKAQETKDFQIKNFTEISVASGIDLYLTQGSAEQVKVVTHSDLMKNLVIIKEGNALKISYKDNVSWSRIVKGQSIKVYVSYKTLQALSASGGSDVYTQNTLKTDRLVVKGSGGSDLKLNVVTKDIQIQISGGSDVELKGTGVNMDAKASGGSDIDAYGFVTEYAKVTVSGGSDGNVNVSKALEASATGGSDVNYKGNPSVKKTSLSKSGDVNKID